MWGLYGTDLMPVGMVTRAPSILIQPHLMLCVVLICDTADTGFGLRVRFYEQLFTYFPNLSKIGS